MALSFILYLLGSGVQCWQGTKKKARDERKDKLKKLNAMADIEEKGQFIKVKKL